MDTIYLPNEIVSKILNYVIADYVIQSKQTKRICFSRTVLDNNCANLMINLSRVNSQWRKVLHNKCVWNKCGWSFKVNLKMFAIQ